MIIPRKQCFGVLVATALGARAVLGQGDPQGTIKATMKVRPDGSLATTIVDPDKKTAEEAVTDSAGKVLKKTLFLLDDRNFATGAIHYDAKGTIRYKESYRRDASDRISESTLYSQNDRVVGKRVFHYDGKGRAQIQDYDVAGHLITPPRPARAARPDKKKR